eukprot:gnl/TRDRNA2_/TRDRNA2_185342_c0_seq1.p1 gnl/TRDRNA2_/TRDRNA2_185342_c0~~gnl/TRDRNA2_/TRDRNA2_185342_c0_seq1.p1  ORF type:complete len:120 (+),score=1.07 gnl/TRDRNA2_/TRDRNA2_185342_c0_seq1:61-420(+)
MTTVGTLKILVLNLYHVSPISTGACVQLHLVAGHSLLVTIVPRCVGTLRIQHRTASMPWHSDRVDRPSLALSAVGDDALASVLCDAATEQCVGNEASANVQQHLRRGTAYSSSARPCLP